MSRLRAYRESSSGERHFARHCHLVISSAQSDGHIGCPSALKSATAEKQAVAGTKQIKKTEGGAEARNRSAFTRARINPLRRRPGASFVLQAERPHDQKRR